MYDKRGTWTRNGKFGTTHARNDALTNWATSSLKYLSCSLVRIYLFTTTKSPKTSVICSLAEGPVRECGENGVKKKGRGGIDSCPVRYSRESRRILTFCSHTSHSVSPGLCAPHILPSSQQLPQLTFKFSHNLRSQPCDGL